MIDTKEKLDALLVRIRAAEWLALDTEADSLHAYPEKICLIQITTAAGDELIDPLALDIAPLLECLNAHELIMHGSDYDLRLFRKHHAFVPRAIFDTMLAARLLGEAQFGLSNLAEKFLGVKLDKGSQKADWAQRPLTPRMEDYARNDTRHLKALSDKLKFELQQKGRLSWHQESCDWLVEECAEEKLADPDKVWRVKGANVLNPAGLAVLRELWRWREDEALAGARPPFFILSHDTLINIAGDAVGAQSIDPFIPPRFSERRRSGLKHAIERGLKVPEQEQPQPVKHFSRRQTEAERQRFDDIQRRRDARAKELLIDPTLIASRATMLAIAEDWELNKGELMNWQRELLAG